jgi:hypothetical protein
VEEVEGVAAPTGCCGWFELEETPMAWKVRSTELVLVSCLLIRFLHFTRIYRFFALAFLNNF